MKNSHYLDGVMDICTVSGAGIRHLVTIIPPAGEGNASFCLNKVKEWEGEHPRAFFLRNISFGLPGGELICLQKGGIGLHLQGRRDMNHKFLFFEAIEGYDDAGDIKQNGKTIGVFYNVRNVKYFWLGPFFPETNKGRIADATGNVIKQIFETVSGEGGTPSDIVRTWYFLSDIENDYGLFNATRTKIYSEYGITEKSLPASTGVGFSYLNKKVYGIAFAAIPQKKHIIKKSVISSKIQCDPFTYGSSFSRAIEITSGNFRRLFISGTASIGKKGESISGDFSSQVRNSIKAVLAIIEDRKFSTENIVFAMGYYDANIPVSEIAEICKKAGIPRIILLPGKICRKELLFELEVECQSV